MTARGTWGVDLSTDPRRTSAVRMSWSPGHGGVTEVITPLSAPDLVDLIRGHADESWAVDVPFGWPRDFGGFLTAHRDGPTIPAYDPGSWASPYRLRRTDRRLTAGDPPRRLTPLSASHDRLGSVAVLWARVEADLAAGDPPVRIDRSGMTGTIVETYPAGVRAALGLPRKGATDEHALLRATLAAAGIDVGPLTGDAAPASEHTWDALLCALAARAHQLGDRPPLSDEEAADGRIEGWIHLPSRPLVDLVAPVEASP